MTDINTNKQLTFMKRSDDDNRFDTTDVVMHSDAMTVPEILEDFRTFLLGCGYPVPGELYVDEDE